MWVKKDGSWLKTVALGGFALPDIWVRTLAITGLSVVSTVLYETVPALHYSIGATPFALIGLPLGIFLGFRNNAAYDRFWEARKLWGALVNTSRSITRQVLTVLEVPETAPEADKRELETFKVAFVHYVIGFVHALRHHLRDSSPFENLGHILPDEETKRLKGQDNVPYAMLQRMGEMLVVARRRQWLDRFHVPIVEASLVSLTDIQGACERIKNTPIPFSYTVLLHRIVAVYCLLLPFGLMDTIKWATPVVALVISYCFFGLDAVGDEIEQPFGLDTNDLPLKSIARTIERNLRERLAEELPPPVAPKKGILS